MDAIKDNLKKCRKACIDVPGAHIRKRRDCVNPSFTINWRSGRNHGTVYDMNLSKVMVKMNAKVPGTFNEEQIEEKKDFVILHLPVTRKRKNSSTEYVYVRKESHERRRGMYMVAWKEKIWNKRKRSKLNGRRFNTELEAAQFVKWKHDIIGIPLTQPNYSDIFVPIVIPESWTTNRKVPRYTEPELIVLTGIRDLMKNISSTYSVLILYDLTRVTRSCKSISDQKKRMKEGFYRDRTFYSKRFKELYPNYIIPDYIDVRFPESIIVFAIRDNTKLPNFKISQIIKDPRHGNVDLVVDRLLNNKIDTANLVTALQMKGTKIYNPEGIDLPFVPLDTENVDLYLNMYRDQFRKESIVTREAQRRARLPKLVRDKIESFSGSPIDYDYMFKYLPELHKASEDSVRCVPFDQYIDGKYLEQHHPLPKILSQRAQNVWGFESMGETYNKAMTIVISPQHHVQYIKIFNNIHFLDHLIDLWEHDDPRFIVHLFAKQFLWHEIDGKLYNLVSKLHPYNLYYECCLTLSKTFPMTLGQYKHFMFHVNTMREEGLFYPEEGD